MAELTGLEIQKGAQLLPEAPGKSELACDAESHREWAAGPDHALPGVTMAPSSHICSFISKHLLSTYWVQDTFPGREPGPQLT